MMKDTEILSTFHELDPHAGAARPARVLVFDACQLGVVLRAVLFVELVMAVGALFGVVSALDWVLRLALLTGAARPFWQLVIGAEHRDRLHEVLPRLEFGRRDLQDFLSLAARENR